MVIKLALLKVVVMKPVPIEMMLLIMLDFKRFISPMQLFIRHSEAVA